MSADTRWDLDECFSWERFEHGPELGFARLHLAGSPVDFPRAKLSDAVPFSDKTLAKKTRPLLSLSREFHEGVKNPLYADTSRNWFGFTMAERKKLVEMERKTRYFVNVD